MITFLTSSSSFRRGKKNLWSFSSSVVLDDDDGDEILPLFFRGAALSPRGTEEEEEEEEEERDEEEREDRNPTKSLPFPNPLLGVSLLIVDFSEERVREGRRVVPDKGAGMSWFFLRKGGGQMKNSFEEKKIFTTYCSYIYSNF